MALSADQRRAVEMLASGMTQGETAKEIGFSRQTVNEWVRTNSEFKAALEDAIDFVGRESLQRMKGRVAKVVSRLEMCVDSDDDSTALKAIDMWLKQIRFGEKAAEASGIQPSQTDVAEMVEFFRWRAERQATAAEEARSEEDGSDSPGTSD